MSSECLKNVQNGIPMRKEMLTYQKAVLWWSGGWISLASQRTHTHPLTLRCFLVLVMNLTRRHDSWLYVHARAHKLVYAGWF